ncbi:amidohydrolase family protein [Nesterenkonia sp. Hz 6-5]|nr:amidohydrolase family protein [Nesterenkonia haasae]
MEAIEHVVWNATILTMDDEDTVAEAMAIGGGRIVAVGSNEEILQLAGEGNARRDLRGLTVMPGLIDTHNHHNLAGEADLYRLNFPPTASIEEIVQSTSEWAKQLGPGEWVLGETWGSGRYGELSTSEALQKLDAATGNIPVLLTDDSHHNKWANSEAMRRGGIFALESDPPGGHVVRDIEGRPTGLLIETAGALVEQARLKETGVPKVDHVSASSERAIQMLHEFGVTAFQDAATTREIMAGLKTLDSQGRLKAWVVSSMLVNDFIFGTEFLGEPLLSSGEQHRTVHHRPDFAKIFLDGVPPSRTGAFLEPYIPDDVHGHNHCGGTTMPIEELETWLRRCAELGIGAKIHCTGDASVRAVLDVVEKLRRDDITDMKVHIAHGSYTHPNDVARYGQLDVVAEISPALWYPGVIVEALRSVLPEPRASRIHPNRDLLDTGATLAGGSDWPVSEDPNPWPAIYGLVTRRNPTGEFQGTLWPEQAITLNEALRVYTTGPAEAMGLDDTIGRLAPGYSADFLVLEKNPFTTDLEEIKDFTALETWFSGDQVYAKK